jgi:hypothetical protein
MGLEVMPEWVPAWAPEGDWFVCPGDEYERQPVFVRLCMHEGWREDRINMLEECAREHNWSKEDFDKMVAQHDAEWTMGHHQQCFGVVPFYSTDIAAAWEVVEKLHEIAAKGIIIEQTFGGQWMVCIGHNIGNVCDNKPIECETAPLAICRAALKAVV